MYRVTADANKSTTAKPLISFFTRYLRRLFYKSAETPLIGNILCYIFCHGKKKIEKIRTADSCGVGPMNARYILRSFAVLGNLNFELIY